MGLLIVVLAVAGAVVAVSYLTKGGKAQSAADFDDAAADARRWIERLGSQVLSISGTDVASTQAMADASERYNAASSQISTAQTVKQAGLARESALEGLHFVNAARDIMGLPAGPELPPLEGQRQAGQVTEDRTINFEGRQITVSPQATPQANHYHPGGMVAGRPVPAGWYSEPWWASALRTGVWTAGSVLLFSSLFNGMSGIGYDASAFESGYGDGFQDGMDAAGSQDVGDAGADTGGDFDFGGGDFGGGDFGGFDF
ncbi:hypothetical protein CKALI_02900 [Corynebacterium kalinowskii]|uniref:DUF1542 domain-containing protein n=1 Tax=Corynebacterium kalinowskii TaxID=2675216 RepID=A0A6B8VR13_9CORY|nr:DUF1542 domain-containing protein [Corynebacterium kalinowskii]QGU01465.1 hypothetical protein CKALI_02900 [Corynebacterium kalinowskii]